MVQREKNAESSPSNPMLLFLWDKYMEIALRCQHYAKEFKARPVIGQPDALQPGSQDYNDFRDYV